MTFEMSEAVQRLIDQYYPKKLPEITLPPVHISMDSRKIYKHYDFPNNMGGISQTFEDEKVVKETFWYPYIKGDDVVFDIGADMGSYTLPALARGAFVVAATPENYDYLVHNIKVNDWLYPTRVIPIEAAFYSKPGYLEFVQQTYAEKEHYANMYKVTTIDLMFKEWDQPIDLMKIDVEGAELDVLKGGMELIKKTKPKLLVECHEFKFGGIANEIMRLMQPLGYTWKQIDNRSTKYLFLHT